MIERKKRYFNQVTRGLSSMLSIQTCQKFSGIHRISPFYHTVSGESLPHIKPLYNVRTVDQFKKDLIELRNHYEFVDAAELKSIIESKSSRQVAFLSFDDGLKQCHSVIRPILKQLSIPACFFINRDFTRGVDIFYRYKVALILSAIENGSTESTQIQELTGYLKDKNLYHSTLEYSLGELRFENNSVINELIRLIGLKDWEKGIYMNELEVQELVNDGFNIGGHSLNHAEFSALNSTERLNQIKTSVDYCQEKYGEPMRLFAFPFFDYNMKLQIFKSMYEELKIDMSFGTSGLKNDVYDKNIQRLDMEDNSGDVNSFLKNALFMQGLRRIIGKDQMKRRS